VKQKNKTEVSKQLAYILRHNPASANISLDPGGWTEVGPVLKHLDITEELLRDIVDTDQKGRYKVKATKIRANQGHSLDGVMAINLTPITPPDVLFHGTTSSAWFRIEQSGKIKKMSRHHVHLSADIAAAEAVAKRRKGQLPCVVWIDSATMYKDGYEFFLSDNSIWLTDHVPFIYIMKHTIKE
jgi:putative RNA 2'-phosphotransferase